MLEKQQESIPVRSTRTRSRLREHRHTKDPRNPPGPSSYRNCRQAAKGRTPEPIPSTPSLRSGESSYNLLHAPGPVRRIRRQAAMDDFREFRVELRAVLFNRHRRFVVIHRGFPGDH